MTADPKHILITGASSGIGAALARRYAGAGRRLTLTGRDAARLAGVAADCRAAGAEVAALTLDVTDRAATAQAIEAADRARPLDLLIANAGVSGGTGKAGAEPEEQARRIFATNLDGLLNSVQPAVALMTARGRGQLGLMASLAAFRGFPGAPAYSASKAAVRVYGEALRGHLADKGVSVSVICPGYVKSPMTAVNAFPMPLLMEAERAAEIIAKGLARDRARIAFPRRLYALVWLLAALPPALIDPLLRRLPEKG
ncbi:SDR family NAD(P)-dependent oxidoreductase [Algihabitans albus]|uniref:SDR family NAD(P)-dependent oxidoreductase n=1 Tax=Algihabitans albus TaxID=2164067 RepID=UPI000E5CD567|nr:SDR family NAD(P)-dependent oxidoreductase [Algihabitans albus]